MSPSSQPRDVAESANSHEVTAGDIVLAEPNLDQGHAAKCELASEVLRTSGRLRLQVNGWSMLPTIWPGDTLQLERARREELSAGDIVLFHRDRRLFAHRIVATAADMVTTRGDAMPQSDPTLAEDQVLGRVAYIVRDGRCIEPTKTLSLSQWAVAGIARSSGFGARVIVELRGMLRSN